MAARKRVVVWGTGSIGSQGLRKIIEHPDLELVGLHVWSKEKIGQDAGDIAGTGKTGIVGTNDVEALLDLKADCLAHFGQGPLREAAVTAEAVRFLERGTNVVSCSLMDPVHSKYGRPEFVEPLAEACRKGQASLFSSGLEPGYGTTGLTMSLLAIAGKVDQVIFHEIVDNSTYSGHGLDVLYGMGKPLDFRPALFTDLRDQLWHTSTLLQIADYLGVELDEIQQSWETAAVDHDQPAWFGVIKAGTTAACRWTVSGMSNGKPVVVYKKVERHAPDAAPDWEMPSGEAKTACYRVIVKGAPNLDAEVNLEIMDAIQCVTLHPINAIPAVCDAPPGILDPMDLPVFFTKTLGDGIKRKTDDSEQRVFREYYPV
ncbi:hypothetical protein BSL82_11915 [Tardibacter chloracetimidivorans]|uniref:HTH cro/C1-type domain-containing protein n=1 Tax=Tardibacter chloracetimidivorans TaxID=1921510 RepID=A0A1L3ZWC1_9SPHN|nr:hypothetical protein [Tardibacter chloracetimidivorans]API59928.1 hypothetical protein BSL82_11915 [Tardibacter chloracetimidivorans]